MTIKEVSEKFNVSQDTLRFYEKVGLISPVPKKNGRRDYGQKDVDNLEFIFCMRSAGLPIEVLKTYIDLCKKGDNTVEQRKSILIEQRDNLKSKLDEMQKALDKLNYKIDVYYTKMVGKEKELIKVDA